MARLSFYWKIETISSSRKFDVKNKYDDMQLSSSKTPRRSVPAHIPRPDYADDLRGRSRLEEEEKSSGCTIRILNEDEQDLLRDTCKVCLWKN